MVRVPILLEHEAEGAVELRVEAEAGLIGLEPGEKQEYVAETPIPSGTYRTAELYRPVQEARCRTGATRRGSSRSSIRPPSNWRRSAIT